MRVLWAIDAVGESALLVERAAEFLRHLAARTALEIEPVTVLEGIRSEAGPEDRLFTEEQAIPALKKSLQSITSEFDDLSAHFVDCTVLGGSTFSAPKRLAQHALGRSADLILCSTHARHGIPRLVIGSFTEELLKVSVKTSGVPVAVVRTLPVPEPTHAAFWMDFDSVEFRRVVRHCKDLGANLTLFHCPERAVEPLIQSGTYLLSGVQPQLHRWTDPSLYRVERRGLAWARWADHQGVECRFVMDERPGSFANHFLECIQAQSAGLAFVGSRSGVRELLRKSPCPVWVLP